MSNEREQIAQRQANLEELVRLGVSDPERAAARLEHWQTVVFQSEDAKEGLTAYVEKRKANFKAK